MCLQSLASHCPRQGWMTTTRGRICHPAARVRRSLNPEAGMGTPYLRTLLCLVLPGIGAPSDFVVRQHLQQHQDERGSWQGCEGVQVASVMYLARGWLAGDGGEGRRARTATQTMRASAVSGVGDGQCVAVEQDGRLPPPMQMPMHSRSMPTAIATCRHSDSSRCAVSRLWLVFRLSTALFKRCILFCGVLCERYVSCVMV